MTKRFAISVVVVLLAIAFTGAGCGDDNGSDDSNGGSAQTETSTKTEKQGGGKVDTNDPEVRQAIEQCKEQANSNPQLSSEAKSKVGEVCEKAASGDADAAVKATREACKIIVEDTAPAGPAKQTAIDACDKTRG